MDRTPQYLLIGGGPASAFAARGIRQADDRGDIAMVAGEQEPPTRWRG